jgi:RimJ/RimL family protein N-acetyltransferase
MKLFVLETPRLLIRQFTQEDLNDLQAILGDPEVMRFSVTGPLDKKRVEEYLQGTLSHYEKNKYGLWALIRKEDHALIGLAGLIKQVIEGSECNELIYRLAKAYWGKGYATEAAQAIKKYAFTTLGINRLVSIIEPANVYSKNVADNIGMHPVKSTKFHGFDVTIYEVHRIILCTYTPEWKKIFQEEKEKLQNLFGTYPIAFHHIGSTAIPNCEAKPIIDILGITNDVLQIDQFNRALEKASYIPLGEFGMKQRRFFRKREPCGVNLHIFEDSDPEAARHLRFRDFLTTHPEEVRAYSRLKQQLATKDPSDMIKYILGKENFIKSIDRRAALADRGSYWNKVPYPRKATWSQSEIIHAMDANMQLAMTYFAKYLSELQLIYEPDVIVVRSSLHSDTFNQVIAARFNEKNVSQRVSHILELFRAKQLPFTWWVSERDTPNFLEKELIAQGLSYKEDDVCMYLFLDQKKFSRTIPELTMQRVFEQKTLQDFATVMTSIGSYDGIYEQLFSKIPQVLYGEGSPYEMYVGFIDDMPVVTGTLVSHANVAGIYYVITHPSHRKKGYGTEMMLSLLKRAQEKGYHVSTLQASSSGRSLYQRLGFQQNCRFVEYA